LQFAVRGALTVGSSKLAEAGRRAFNLGLRDLLFCCSAKKISPPASKRGDQFAAN
jgi:hypothetical protein